MLKFYNIKNGEERVCETEPMIAAFWASSDRGPNARNGQDFGWRLAPETVVEVRRIQESPEEMRNIAINYGIIPENISESDVLKFISDKNNKEQTGMDQTKEDFEAKYKAEIAALEAKAKQSETTENDENVVKSKETEKSTNKSK